MANQKISQLTAVTTPADSDEFAVNQSSQSKKMTLAQVVTYVESNIDPDNISFTSVTGDLDATNVGDALRQLWEDNASMLNGNLFFQGLSYYDLPDSSAYPYSVAMCLDTGRGIRPVYNDGTGWRYFSDDISTSPPIPQGNLSFDVDVLPPSVQIGVRGTAGDIALSGSAPSATVV